MQSVLSPMGPDAARIAGLAEMLFIGAAVIVVLVMTISAVALWGNPARKRWLATDRLVLLGGVAFPVVVLTALLVYGLWIMRSVITESGSQAALVVDVGGEQWWWRVAYRLPDGGRLAEANEIRVPVGQDVEFALTSPDVIHSFWVPALSGKVDMIPGRTNRLRFKADRPGVYRGQCAEYCGGAHALMAFDVVAMELDAFKRWLAAGGSADPTDPGALRGRDLFLAAGCGSCHAVRGTAAAGVIGPDLSRLGERRTLAAGTLPMSRDNIARFIAESQHVKPGNLMPQFAIFSPPDLDAIAGYLAGLK